MSQSNPLDYPQRHEQYGLGRLPHADERDQQYLMSMVMRQEVAPQALRSHYYYTTGPVMDQGQTSMCEEFSHNQWLSTYPVVNQRVMPVGTLYHAAQAIDPWKDQPHEGTTTRAMMQVLQSRGLVGNYVWAFDVEPVRQWILTGRGPVVVGTIWHRSMFKPDARSGIIPVDRTSPIDGGHAYMLSGANDSRKLFRITNSWNTTWGQGGRAWISYDDLGYLLSQQGECCTAVEQFVG